MKRVEGWPGSSSALNNREAACRSKEPVAEEQQRICLGPDKIHFEHTGLSTGDSKDSHSDREKRH